VKVGIINVTGYAGMELARILWRHPMARVVAATGRSLAGKKLGEAFPHLAAYDLTISEEVQEADFIFSALPSAASAEACEPWVRKGVPVVDIAADFRLKDPEAFEQWYGQPHPAPDLLEQSVYGLPELHKDHIAQAQVVANPGCYPTTALLALAPAYAEGLINDNIVVDAKSGISGAGRGSGSSYGYGEVNESVSAYRVEGHAHLPEITQELGVLRGGREPGLTFVPHLIPMTRGILATCYAPLTRSVTRQEVHSLYRKFYSATPFTRVVDYSPATKYTLGNNMCLVYPTVDERTNTLIAIGVIDNLVKGAAGQAVQNMNLMCGFPEDMSLEALAVYP
jgi:N-acetyl-gamma-glutamyl-phosphate reductase